MLMFIAILCLHNKYGTVFHYYITHTCNILIAMDNINTICEKVYRVNCFIDENIYTYGQRLILVIL